MHDSLPKLTPKFSPWMSAALESPVLLKELIQKFSSPVNVHHVEPFRDNLQGFQSVLTRELERFQIFYACKANRCPEFIAAALKSGFGIDTGSAAELQKAISFGGDQDTVVLTSAIKTPSAIDTAIGRRIPIVLDNFDEIELVTARARELRTPARVGVRVSGFPMKGGFLESRFGFSCVDFNEVLEQIRLSSDLECQGLHFHLNGYSLEERLSALQFFFSHPRLFGEDAMAIRFIDIGGGIPVCYLESESEWKAFHEALIASLKGERKPVTFGNHGLGYTALGEEIAGKFSVYPYWNNLSKWDYIERLLTSTLHDGQTVARHFNSRKVEFRMEPGRALLDQCGFTAARVAFRKKSNDGRYFVGLEMNHSQLTSSSLDFLLDPILVTDRPAAHTPTEAYFSGNYCLERDMILKRAVMLPSLPEVGDIIVFPNTAAYMMHLHENEGHRVGLARNIFIDPEDV